MIISPKALGPKMQRTGSGAIPNCQAGLFRLALLAAALAPAASAFAGSDLAEVSGPTVALDGQTVEVRGRRMTLKGVLAPPLGMACRTKHEKPYPCGQLARTALSDIVRNQVVVCRAEPNPGRGTLAVCRVGPFDVNEQMILSGRALAGDGAGERLRRAERAARLLGEGLWKGRFPPSAEWRQP